MAMRALGFEPKKEEIKKMISDIDKVSQREDRVETFSNRTRVIDSGTPAPAIRTSCACSFSMHRFACALVFFSFQDGSGTIDFNGQPAPRNIFGRFAKSPIALSSACSVLTLSLVHPLLSPCPQSSSR